MIKPLLEGFDPDRSPLLFCRILTRCVLSAQFYKFGNGIRDLRTLCQWAETAPSPDGDCDGYSAGYTLMRLRQCLLWVCALPQGAMAPLAAAARFATVGNWTARLARSASMASQVR